MHVAAEHARWQGEGGDRGSDVELRQTLASLYRQATPASRQDCASDSRRPHHHRTEHYAIYRYCTELLLVSCFLCTYLREIHSLTDHSWGHTSIT